MSKNTAAKAVAETRLEHFTMTANWFFDHLLYNENISVARVVGYFFRNTFGRTGPDGRRVEMLQTSHKWLAGRTGLSERAVGDGLRKAVARKYLIEVRPGHKATKDAPGEGGWYRVNWDWLEQNYVKLVEPVETVAQSNPEDNLTIEAVVIPSPQDYSKQERLNSLPEQNYVKLVEPKILEEPEVAAQTLPGEAAQTLPEVAAQTLPAWINTPELNSNKAIEIKARAWRDELSVSVVTLASAKDKAEKPTKRPYSRNIAELIASFTPELGDNPARKQSNIRRALNLWAASGLAEKEFLALLYQSRHKARACDKVQHRRDSRPNRMPYFFQVVSNELSVVSNQSSVVSNELVGVSEAVASSGFGEVVTSEATAVVKVEAEKVRSSSGYGEAEASSGFGEAANEEAESQTFDEVEPVEMATEVEERLAQANSVPLPAWLTSAQHQALAQAELNREKLGTHVRFGLKLARSWHKDCFQDWHLQRLALELADAGGTASLVILD